MNYSRITVSFFVINSSYYIETLFMQKFLKVHNLVAGLRCLPDLSYGNSKLLSKHTVQFRMMKKLSWLFWLHVIQFFFMLTWKPKQVGNINYACFGKAERKNKVVMIELYENLYNIDCYVNY